MKCVWQRAAAVVGGLLMTAVYALPQYTISARPGVVNYIEGNAFLNGKSLSSKGLQGTFLNPNDTLSTDIGKAEVLLTPGVFLRLGQNTQIRMVSPSLTDTQVEVKQGEAIIEADGLLKDNHITVLDHGSSMSIDRNGLYRFNADNPPTAAVLDGKADVFSGTQRVELSKGHEAILSDNLKSQKFNSKQADDLYAWSNIRSEYDAATSYRTATAASFDSFGGGWGNYGYAGGFAPGWYWNSAFSGFGWLPSYGAFYSPFGYGFYAPAVVAYAPVVTTPVYSGGGSGVVRNWRTNGSVTRAAVPVNPNNPAAVGTVTASPYANQVARASARQVFANTGFRTGSGNAVPASSGWSGARGSVSNASQGWSGAAAHAGGFSGGGHAGAAGGGGHR